VSSALAIAGVTAVLKDMLSSGIVDQDVTRVMGEAVIVSALAPDAVQLGSDATPRLNLFLHQVTHNAGWRNVGQPARDAAGERTSNPPLALDLHYFLTAYASSDLQAEVLLGHAMLLLHETPVLPRGAIRKALNPPSPAVNEALLPNIYQALRDSGLADQIELIKVTPAAMSGDEVSKLWSAFQAHYRPTMSYQASVVLIESQKEARAPLPVLKRGPLDPVTKRELGAAVRAGLQSPVPEVTSIKYPRSQIAASLGDTIEIGGHDLDGSAHALLLSNPRLGLELEIAPPVQANAGAVRFTIPISPDALPAGPYAATLRFQPTGEPRPRSTNELAVAIAPEIVSLPATASRDADGNLALTPTCRPEVRPGQRISLILGGIEAAIAPPFDAPTSTPRFVFRDLSPGLYWVRLRVDGIDSPLVDRTTSPPSFAGPQIEVH
jgi:hypothetical protein